MAPAKSSALFWMVALATIGLHGKVFGGIAADNTASACSKNLTDNDAPVIKPLTDIMGPQFVDGVRGFFLNSAFGHMLLNETTSVCFANMDGMVLGNAFKTAFGLHSCQKLANLTLQNPLYSKVLSGFATKNVSSSSSPSSSVFSLIETLGQTTFKQLDEFCDNYEQIAMPCLTNQLLPALTTVRRLHSNGCCDKWAQHTNEFYSSPPITFITEMFQKVGNLICSRQNATTAQIKAMQAESKDSKQTVVRCGSTLLGTLNANQTPLQVAQKFFEMLQIPTNQVCLFAEGKEYNNTNGDLIPAVKNASSDAGGSGATQTAVMTPSGCMLGIDNFFTWLASLPEFGSSMRFDSKALFGDGRCIKGSEVAWMVELLFPEIQDFLDAQFAKVCVHLSTNYAAKCSFSRPATLITWPAEALRQSASHSSSSSSAAAGAIPQDGKGGTSGACGHLGFSMMSFVPSLMVSVVLLAQNW